MRASARARAAIRKLYPGEKPWRGPVERFVSLSPERRVALGLEATERRRSVVEFWKCTCCREFTPRGSRAAGRCLICHTPKPDEV